MTRISSILMVAAIAACGGKSKPPPPPVDNHATETSGNGTGGAMIDDALGGDQYGGDTYGGDIDRQEGEYAMNPAAPSPATPTLVGLWVSDCAAGDEKGQFRRLTYNIGVDTWALRSETFADDKCSKRKVLLEMAGSYELKGESQTVKGAWETESTISSRALTADDKATATKLGKACKAKLKPGVATDIHTTGCAALGELPADKLCTEYDIAGADDTRGELHTGLRGTDDLCAPERRPTAYGPTVLTAHWNPTGNADCDTMGALVEKLTTCPKFPVQAAGALRGQMRTMNTQLTSAVILGGADQACRTALTTITETIKQMGC